MVSVSSVCVFVRLRVFVFMCGASAMKVNAWDMCTCDPDLDCWDLKDGACSPRTVKSGETLVDARGDTDVQIIHYASFWDERQTETIRITETEQL